MNHPRFGGVYNSGEDSIQIETNNVDHSFSPAFLSRMNKMSRWGIKVENAGRNSIRLLIDDWVTFSSF